MNNHTLWIAPIMRQTSSTVRAARPSWLAAFACAALPMTAVAQPAPITGTSDGASVEAIGLWSLFMASFDLFTIVLVLGSLVAGALIVRCLLEVRPEAINPAQHLGTLTPLASRGDAEAIRSTLTGDESVIGATLLAAVEQLPRGTDAARDAAELSASNAVASWFRRIEPLSVIGNLGPLIGLAGTVWGMILAFTQLAAVGGEADPSLLSEGISKALFHTLLGLLLAIPCLLVHGLYRSMIEKHTNRALEDAGVLVEALLSTEQPNTAGSDAPTESGQKPTTKGATVKRRSTDPR